MAVLRVSRQFGTRSNVVTYHNTFTVEDHRQIISHQLQVENEKRLECQKVSFKRIKIRYLYLIN